MADQDAGEISDGKRVFKDRSNENLMKLLESKDKANTQKLTEAALKQFSQYLHQKELPKRDFT